MGRLLELWVVRLWQKEGACVETVKGEPIFNLSSLVNVSLIFNFHRLATLRKAITKIAVCPLL